MTLSGVGAPTQLKAQIVSAEFFSVLGVGPALGRTLSEDYDRRNAPRVLVLSHRLWQQRFGGDPNVIGRVVQVNDRPVEIVGVMPASFLFVYPDNDVWAAFGLERNQPWRQTAGRFLHVVGGFEPGRTLVAARAEMEAIARRLAAQYEFIKNTSVKLVPRREELTGQVHTALVLLYGAVALLLVIACLNVVATCFERGRPHAAGKSRSARRSVPDVWQSSGSCSDAIDTIRPGAEAKSVEIVADVSTGLFVRGDGERLQQVFWNLLSNACKFTPADGRIDVTLSEDGPWVRLRIADTGAGIPAEFMPFVFDRFRQADQTITRGHGGLGLGLAIVKHLVEMHGGEMAAQSEGPGKGSAFEVRLPLARARRNGKASPADASPGVESAGELTGHTVLVVDDDEATRRLMEAILARDGARVMASLTGADTGSASVAAADSVADRPDRR